MLVVKAAWIDLNCNKMKKYKTKNLTYVCQFISYIRSYLQNSWIRLNFRISMSSSSLAGDCVRCQDYAWQSELSPTPKIFETSLIQGISGNSTENSTDKSALFSKWLKTLQKASTCYKTV